VELLRNFPTVQSLQATFRTCPDACCASYTAMPLPSRKLVRLLMWVRWVSLRQSACAPL